MKSILVADDDRDIFMRSILMSSGIFEYSWLKSSIPFSLFLIRTIPVTKPYSKVS